MEFYYGKTLGIGGNLAFQFPTGWNSTRILLTLLGLAGVSIPNGMEFYSVPLTDLALGGRFNSQRDGILQFFRAFMRVVGLVSIPNGMEFYPPAPNK